MRPPIIFTGMHRSGTSMIGRMLEALGLFVGLRKDENNEALFFQEMNEWLLHQCGASWDDPTQLRKYFWRNEAVVGWSERYLRNLISSPRSISFTGPMQYLKGGVNSLDTPWGWKDPRNTFALPIWLKIFPDAKIIYIKRNGVDVAQSLRVRELKKLADAARFYAKWQYVFFLRPRKGGFVGSSRCLELDDAFSLWREYIEEAEAVLSAVPSERLLRLRYEDVLDDPAAAIKIAVPFCGLSATDEQINSIAGSVVRERSGAYEATPELRAFASRHAAELRAVGYEP
ncbi:sulfotransferase [Bradyrhizobium sp. DOA1]|uniref:sulfotransferase n=1 Tax=Bradyrhizobium sp. DOA1 TaxID=1126616 RepID=UPI0009EDCAD6|nr:sulfotransferase [Bradyrhizobium sp. DOA1]